MSEQPNEKSSLLDRVASVMPWIGGAVVLAVAFSVVSSSWGLKQPIAPPSVSSAALTGDLVPQQSPSQSLPVAASSVAESAVETTPSLGNSQATDQPASIPQDRSAFYPPPDDIGTTSAAVASATSSAPTADVPSTSSPSYVASSPGEVYVHGYYRKNGTYVQPYFRTAPDGIKSNNWSSKGNINPHTGKRGTK
jgi:hypothetical protein